jgi:hypothetical protein
MRRRSAEERANGLVLPSEPAGFVRVGEQAGLWRIEY